KALTLGVASTSGRLPLQASQGYALVPDSRPANLRGWHMDDRAEEIKAIPIRPANKSAWPPGIRSISLGEADALGTDAKGELYWHGKPVEIRRPLDLTFWQKF